MAGKDKIAAPIDRPLSRAYLREFSGWSTAYPPGLSEPTSLRIMENVMINRDGSAGVRPGLRYLSYDELPADDVPGTALSEVVIGSHEVFFLNSGQKAYLFAVRELDGTVGFRVLSDDPDLDRVSSLTEAGFEVPQTEAVLNFTGKTTYVKYVQIDNKIFALSNAGETMRLFTVGGEKTARRLSSIERPEWSVSDKLTVVHPEAAWINGNLLSSKPNRVFNPSFETNLSNWSTILGKVTRTTEAGSAASAGIWAVKLESQPVRTNLMPRPLHDPVATGVSGWTTENDGTVEAVTENGESCLKAMAGDPPFAGMPHPGGQATGPTIQDVVPGQRYDVAGTFVSYPSGSKVGITARFLDSSGAALGVAESSTWSAAGTGPERRQLITGPAPAGSAKMRVTFNTIGPGSGPHGPPPVHLYLNKVNVCKQAESSAFFSGDSGANYHWTGDINNSPSVYHPPADATIESAEMPISGDSPYIVSWHHKAAGDTATVVPRMVWRTSSGATISTTDGAAAPVAIGTWDRFSFSATSEPLSNRLALRLVAKNLGFGEYVYIDAVMTEFGSTLNPYFDGDSTDTPTLIHRWTGTEHGSLSYQDTYSGASAVPTPETPTTNTLISSSAGANDYNFGFFYTFTNEIGESAASQVTVVKAQRKWTGWSWQTPNVSGEPSGTAASDPIRAADQLVAYMPEDVFNEAINQGAISWNLYMLTWSDQDAVPVLATLIGTKNLVADSAYGSAGWQRLTAVTSVAGDESALLPTEATRFNYSTPSSGGQGIVAADRMVLVKDPVASAVIRWSSNRQGYYTDFTSRLGGGYKTLTSGNLYIPACVKLWQNPQSADTLTVLCMGVDGMSTGYYMAPAQVASQSEATSIMAFEETTATPGTTSPYGCEVFNNALYHPLDEMLMKSTASNYNINHKEQTEQIRNKWSHLQDKVNIVSSQHDNRLYYIVHNPDGEALEVDCMGNEVWVFDAATDAGTWSRFLIQACSLRKIERNGHVYMSVSRPDGLYCLDPEYDRDDYVSAPGGDVLQRHIPWRLETNTQGANRAHDAWAHLQMLSLTLGNFQGHMRYGIHSFDLHGKPVERSKIVRDLNPPDTLHTYDLEDYLQVKRDLKEWFFFAESVTDEDTGEVLPSAGQLNLVQYRYTPSTVNTGYEFGSVETFEYTRFASNPTDPGFTTNGTPQPMIDTRRP